MNRIFYFTVNFILINMLVVNTHGSDGALNEILSTKKNYGTMEQEEEYLTPHRLPYQKYQNLQPPKKNQNTTCCYFCNDSDNSKKNHKNKDYDNEFDGCFSLFSLCDSNSDSVSHSPWSCDCDFDCDLNFD